MALLQLNQATIRFGGLTAVSELNLQIGRNELVGLIGPNGAGKTTAFNLITGVYQPTGGEIIFDEQSLVVVFFFSYFLFLQFRVFNSSILARNNWGRASL